MSEKDFEAHFCRTMIGAFLCGIVCLLLAAFGLLVLADIGMAGLGASALSVCALALLGVWALSFARRRSAVTVPDAPEEMLIVAETKVGLVLGYLLFPLGIVFWIVSLGEALEGDGEGLFLTLLSLCFLTSAFALMCDYRNRRVLVQVDRLCCVTAFGRSYSFFVGDIAKGRLNAATGGVKLWDANGKVLLRFELNMVNARALLSVVLGPHLGEDDVWVPCQASLAAWRVRQHIPIVFTEADITPLQRHVKKIRTGFKVLSAVNFTLLALATAAFFFWGFSTKSYYLVVSLLPLSFLAYALCFRGVFTWISSGDNFVPPLWHQYHITLLPAVMYVLIAFYLSFSIYLRIMHCIGGYAAYYGAGVVLFLLLLGLWAHAIRGQPRFRSQMFSAAFFCGFLCLLLMPAVFLSASKAPSHMPAATLSHRASSDRGDADYYAIVRLPDGREEELTITGGLYDKMEAGEPVQLCLRESLFGTQFVTLHT